MKQKVLTVLVVFLMIFSFFAHSKQLKTLPKFDDYKTEVANNSHQINRLKLNDKRNRQFKTLLSGFLSGPPNFAGKFVIASWGCGSSCLRHAIINKTNGEVYWPKEIESSTTLFSCDKDTLEYIAGSNLLVANKPYFNGYVQQNFYVWKHNRLKLLRSVETKESKFCEETLSQ